MQSSSFFGFGTVKMLNTQTAVVFGMVYDFLPFMILPIYNSMARIENDVIEAAKDLGASARDRLIQDHHSADLIRHYQRHYHGLCSGTDLLCHLRPARRWKGASDR